MDQFAVLVAVLCTMVPLPTNQNPVTTLKTKGEMYVDLDMKYIQGYIDHAISEKIHDVDARLTAAVDSLAAKEQALEDRENHLEAELHEVEAHMKTHAFSAYITDESALQQSHDAVDGTILVFDHIYVDHDDDDQHIHHYDNHTGKFTAPSGGTYAFTWTLCVDSHTHSDGHGEWGTQLVHGQGHDVCGELHTDTETKDDDDCSTAFVLCEIHTDEEVYIQNMYDHQGNILSKAGQTRTTFSGWKLSDH